MGLFKDNVKTGNLIGLLIGVALLLGCQNILNFDLIWKLAFPTILVVIGISIIFKDTLGGKVSDEIKKLNEKATVFIEYASLEKEWIPIVGDNYYYIYCLWTLGDYRGKGYGKELMKYCISDAKKWKVWYLYAWSNKTKRMAYRSIIC